MLVSLRHWRERPGPLDIAACAYISLLLEPTPCLIAVTTFQHTTSLPCILSFSLMGIPGKLVDMRFQFLRSQNRSHLSKFRSELWPTQTARCTDNGSDICEDEGPSLCTKKSSPHPMGAVRNNDSGTLCQGSDAPCLSWNRHISDFRLTEARDACHLELLGAIDHNSEKRA